MRIVYRTFTPRASIISIASLSIITAEIEYLDTRQMRAGDQLLKVRRDGHKPHLRTQRRHAEKRLAKCDEASPRQRHRFDEAAAIFNVFAHQGSKTLAQAGSGVAGLPASWSRMKAARFGSPLVAYQSAIRRRGASLSGSAITASSSARSSSGSRGACSGVNGGGFKKSRARGAPIPTAPRPSFGTGVRFRGGA